MRLVSRFIPSNYTDVIGDQLTIHLCSIQMYHDTQQSILRFLDTADMRSYFDLRISNSVIVPESSEGTIEKSDRWRFRGLGLEVCDEHEGSLMWGSLSESRGHDIE